MKKIGIITAMPQEADIIINKYNLKQVDSLGMIKKYQGEDKNIVLILSGIGKIQASIATSYLLQNHNNLDKIINIGIAGNLSSYGKIGDVFTIHTCHQHDIYLPFDGEHLNYATKQISIPELSVEIDGNFSLHSGVCATGDQFIDNPDILRKIKEECNADIVEMEAFSILSVAREYNLLQKCIVIKAISDGANNEAIGDHMNNLEFAMNNSIEVLDKII